MTPLAIAAACPPRDDGGMAWLRSLASLLLPCSLLLACNTRGECCEGEDYDDGQLTTTDGTGSTTGATTSMTSTAATSTADAGTSTAATETSATETSAADSTTGPDGPVACTERLTCNPGEICVLPCCGGPAPGCFQLPRGGECGPDGTPDEGGVRCCQNDPDPKACMMLQWCAPVACTPDPPYCATADQLDCNGTSCSAPSCFNGDLVDDQLHCSCK